MVYGAGRDKGKIFHGIFCEGPLFDERDLRERELYSPRLFLIGTAHLVFPADAELIHGLPEYGRTTGALVNKADTRKSLLNEPEKNSAMQEMLRSQGIIDITGKYTAKPAEIKRQCLKHMFTQGVLEPNMDLAKLVKCLQEKADSNVLVAVMPVHYEDFFMQPKSPLTEITQRLYFPLMFYRLSGLGRIYDYPELLEQQISKSWA